MEKMFTTINKSPKVTVHKSKQNNFFDYGGFLGKICTNYKGQIKQNHIFYVDESSWIGNQFIVKLRKSNVPDETTMMHDSVKFKFNC